MSNPVVLDEDTYTEAISLIIERDFFPRLANMKAQHNYLEAQTTGSLADLQQAGKILHNLSVKQKDQRDPKQGINFYNQDEPEIEKRVNLNLSLDQFQTLYTSEDNSSFTELLEKANLKVKEENRWYFDRESRPLLIKDHPDDISSRLIETNEKAPDGTKYKARNALMYYPEGKSESWLKDDPMSARSKPKSIEHHNTHLIATTSLDETALKKLSAPSDIRAAKGHLTPWSQLNGLGGDQGDSNSSVTGAPSATPGIRGYNLVAATPVLSPSRVGTPQMTWGSIEGTPILISGQDISATGPRFSLPEISKREELGMRLSERASKAYRKKTSDQQRRIQGTPRSGAGLMSPAAQHLLKKSRNNTPRAGTGFDDALRSSYGGSSRGASPFFGINSPITKSRRPGATPTPLFRAAGRTPSSPYITKKN